MAKRDVITSVASLSAAFATWRELGREFRHGDEVYGEVGLVTTLGRLAIKVTAATLAYALTDCSFEWLFNAKDKVVTDFQEKQKELNEEMESEESEDEDEDLKETVEVEEDE